MKVEEIAEAVAIYLFTFFRRFCPLALASAFYRLNSSIAITTTTGRPCL
jgi:hypothetical protein